MRVAFAGFALFLLAFAALSGGANVFGRGALGLGLPRVAAAVFHDPGWRGVAHFRAGNFAAAETEFEKAGPKAAFNLGNARVQLVHYPAALEAYDLALAHNRQDAAAEVNFDVVLALYAGTRIDPDSIARWGEDKQGVTMEADVAKGAARAAGTGDEVTNTGATIGVPALQSREQAGVRKVFDDKFVTANPRWLATLADVPGAYLAARISHEFKRRKKAGTGQPELDTEW